MIKKDRLGKYLVFLLLVFLFFKVSPRFDYVDYGVYFKYSRSLVDQGNLNISDELSSLRKSRSEPVIVTPTGYDSDFHSHGTSFLLAPVVVLSDALFTVFLPYLDDYEEQRKAPWKISKRDFYAQVLVSSFVLCLFFLVFYRLRSFGVSATAMFLVSLGTPLYMYTVSIPGNASSIAALMGIPFFWGLFNIRNNIKHIPYIILYLALCIIIKIDFVFYLLVLPYLYKLNRKETLKGVGLSFIPLVCLLVNKYIQYGEIFISYGGVDSSFIPGDILFSAIHGYIFTSPIYVVILFFYFFTCTRQNSQARLTSYLLLVPFIKLIIESFAYSSGVDFGARSHLVDTGLWLMIFTIVESHTKYKKAFVSLSVLCTLWTVVLAILYGGVAEKQSIHYVLGQVRNAIYSMGDIGINYFSNVSIIGYKVISLILILAIIKLVQSKISLKKASVYLLSLYSLTTLSNFYHRDIVSPVEVTIKTADKEKWYYIESMNGVSEHLEYLINTNASDEEIIQQSRKLQKMRKLLD